VKVAVVGVTGIVGETILRVLETRAIAIDRLDAYASRARPDPVVFRGEGRPIAAATPQALHDGAYDAVFFASSDDASAELTQPCLDGGAVVIDNSATFRMAPDVPLVVPEVNADAVRENHRIFPVANCTAIVLTMGIAPIERTSGLRSVRVATYQAVSGAGRAGLERLDYEERTEGARSEAGGDSPFTAPIFRNVIPQVGSFDERGDSGEERKVVEETRKILGLADLHVAATTVRVPIRFAHSEAVFVETERETDVAELGAALEKAPGIVFHGQGIVTPREVEGQDRVHVGRLRAEGDSRRHFQLWIVGDQTRKGAATNAVQILELLVERGIAGRRPALRAQAS
jgi:aspartate-semialdehyde dehydrogenase